MKLVKLFIAFMILLISGICASASGFDRGLCSFNGVRLSGKVKIVHKDADVKAMIVHDGADLRVKLNDKSDRCGGGKRQSDISDKISHADTDARNQPGTQRNRADGTDYPWPEEHCENNESDGIADHKQGIYRSDFISDLGYRVAEPVEKRLQDYQHRRPVFCVFW